MVYSVFPYEKCCTLYGVIIHQPPAFPATRILFSMNRAVRRCGTAADEMSWQFTAGLTSPKAIRCLQCRRVLIHGRVSLQRLWESVIIKKGCMLRNDW